MRLPTKASSVTSLQTHSLLLGDGLSFPSHAQTWMRKHGGGTNMDVAHTHLKVENIYLLLWFVPDSNHYRQSRLHVRLSLDTGVLKWKGGGESKTNESGRRGVGWQWGGGDGEEVRNDPLRAPPPYLWKAGDRARGRSALLPGTRGWSHFPCS